MAAKMSSGDRERLRVALARLTEQEREALVGLVSALVLELVGRLRGSGPTAATGGGASQAGSPAAGLGDPTAAQVPAGPRVAPVGPRFDGPVLVEHDVLRACAEGATCLRVARSTLLSPLAVDTARERGLTIERLEGSCS